MTVRIHRCTSNLDDGGLGDGLLAEDGFRFAYEELATLHARDHGIDDNCNLAVEAVAIKGGLHIVIAVVSCVAVAVRPRVAVVALRLAPRAGAEDRAEEYVATTRSRSPAWEEPTFQDGVHVAETSTMIQPRASRAVILFHFMSSGFASITECPWIARKASGLSPM